MQIGSFALLANAGTPLMWASALHLFFGNILIGLFEAYLICRAFRSPIGFRGPLLMILANYASAWAGFLAIGYSQTAFEGWLDRFVTVESVLRFHFIALAATFVLTLAVEWPFVWLVLGPMRTVGRSLRANLLAQGASYGLLLVPYLLLSSLTIGQFGSVSVAPPRDFSKPQGAWVYYVNTEDLAVWRMRTSGDEKTRVAEIANRRMPGRLFARLNLETFRWDLYADSASPPYEDTLVVPSFAQTVAVSDNTETRLGDMRSSPPATSAPATTPAYRERWDAIEAPPSSPFDAPADLRPAASRDWVVDCGFWGVEGVSATNQRTGASIRAAVETPFLSWWPRYAVVLPGDQVVYQLGRQIVLMDLNERKIGLLARGVGLVVVPE